MIASTVLGTNHVRQIGLKDLERKGAFLYAFGMKIMFVCLYALGIYLRAMLSLATLKSFLGLSGVEKCQMLRVISVV